MNEYGIKPVPTKPSVRRYWTTGMLLQYTVLHTYCLHFVLVIFRLDFRMFIFVVVFIVNTNTYFSVRIRLLFRSHRTLGQKIKFPSECYGRTIDTSTVYTVMD